MPGKDTYSINEVVRMVERVDQATRGRRDRMDADYALQRSDAYNTNTDAEGGDLGTEFKSFTANEAGAFVRKVVAALAAGKLLIQVPYGAALSAQRGQFDLKERFAVGTLGQANDLLASLLEISLHDQLAWFAAVRGWTAVRALLVNKPDGTTIATARPWDPRNVYWEMGNEGLLWVCYRTSQAAAEILAEYPRANLTVDDDDAPVVKYDFYTAKKNGVMTADVMLKRWTPHGSPRVPVVIVPVPFQPQIWAANSLTNEQGQPDSVDDYGESILAVNRPLYHHLDETMSIILELMSRAREPSSMVFTDEEDTELLEDPNRRGGVHYLGREDKYLQLQPAETTKDALQFLAGITGMLQRGGMPYSAYGELKFALSGFAITQMNQQIMTVLGPEARTIASTIKGVLDLWLDQFTSGAFYPMTIAGMGRSSEYKRTVMLPEMVADLPPYKVEVVPQLPQDDITRLTAAQTARQGDTPFLPDRWLLENFMRVEDSTLVDSMLKEQQAGRAAPGALALHLALAATEAGQPEVAELYLDEYTRIRLKSKLELQKVMQAQPGQPGQPGLPGQPPWPGAEEGPAGVLASILPEVMRRGIPPPPQVPTGLEGQQGLLQGPEELVAGP